MLLALTRRYACRTRSRSHLDALLLLSQSQSSASCSNTNTKGGTIGSTLFPTPKAPNTDWRSHNSPLFPRRKPLFHLDSLFDALRPFKPYGDPKEYVDACFKDDLGCLFRPSESFVLKVLSTYGNADRPLLSYLAIFEWAGKQKGFLHTPKTFDALYKILILAGWNPILLKDLVNVLNFGDYRACFYNTLFVAYLLARLPDLASNILHHLLANGLNTPASYNALVNVLLQHNSVAEADDVLNYLHLESRISLEPNKINIIQTTTTTPNLEWDQANREYLCGLARSGDPFEARFLAGHALVTLVRDHCESKRFKDAVDLIEEFKELSSFHSYGPYNVWINSAYRYAESHFADQLQTANEDIVRHSTSLIGLVAENGFEEASQLLTEMKKELQIMAKPTIRESMYHFLINLLCCGCGNDKSCCVVLAESKCCKEGNFDRLIQVVRLGSYDRLIQVVRLGSYPLPGAFRNFLYNKIISALCRAGRVEDAYALYGEFNMTCWELTDGDDYDFAGVISTTDEACYHMINGFRRINREDVADRLLLELRKPYPYHAE